MKYGELLESLLILTGQKNTVLANELGYDVTYIGKWINGKRLPASKNITFINRSISEFVVEFFEGTEGELKEKLKIENSEDVISDIEKMLLNAYNLSSGKNILDEVSNSLDVNSYDSQGVYLLSPTDRRDFFKDVLNKDVEKVDSLDVIMMTNIYSMSQRDKLYVSGMKKIGIHGISSKDVKVKFINDFTDTNKGDLIYNSVFFINMMSKSDGDSLEIYSYDFAPYNIVTVIKDMFLYNAVFTNSENCLFSTCTRDKRLVNEVYGSLEDIIETQAIQTFMRKSPDKMIDDDIYLDFLGNEHLKIMLSQFSELFLSSELFIELGKTVFGDSKEVTSKLRKIDFFLKNIIGKLKVDVIIYESMFDNYISNGEILFFNKKITLTVEQRIESISFFKKFMENNKYMNLKVVHDDFIKDLKHFDNPSLYLSKKVTFIPTLPDIEEYLIVKDNNLEKSLHKFFDQIWEDKSLLVLDKENAIDSIEKKISYSTYLIGEFTEK